MNDSTKRLINNLEKGVIYRPYSRGMGKPKVFETEELMQDAADKIKELDSKLQEAISLLSEGECPWREGTASYHEYWNRRDYFVERVTNERIKEKSMGSTSGTQ